MGNPIDDPLWASEELFHLLVQSVQDYGIFALDPTGLIMNWNRGAEHIKGYTADEVVGKHFSVFYTTEDLNRNYPQYELEVAARVGRFEDEGWRVRKDGSLFWANVVITALRDPEGNLVGFGKVTRDLTERRLREKQLEEERDARRAAEELTDEIQTQASQLEEQAAEIEAINDELSASRARLEATINSSLDAIVTTGPDSVILEWNKPAEAIFGWSAREAVGMPLSETIIPPQHREGHRRGVERYLATGEGPILNKRIEITAVRRSGQEFPVELTVAPAGEGSQLVFNAFIRDLTETKRLGRQRAAEHALTRVLAESTSLEDAAPRILHAIGHELGWDTGTFWGLNRDAEVLQPIALWNAASGDSSEFATVTLETVFARGAGLPGRVWEIQAPFWIADVTLDQNFPRAEVAARCGFHGAFAFPVVSGDTFRGVIEFFSRQTLEPDQALLQSVATIGSDIAQAIRRLDAEEERNRAVAEIERINEHLRQTNTELAARTAEAETANRVKSDFLAKMSHELRTPINAILGYSDLLQIGIGGPVTEAQRAHLDRIGVSSRHLLGLIEDVLDLAKIEAGRITVSSHLGNAADVMTAALALVEPQAAQHGLKLLNRCPSERDLHFLGDIDRVRQVLANLLTNAVKFTDSGGTVTTACDIRARGETAAALHGEGPWLTMSVEDTGIGIAADQLEAIFDPFTQVDNTRTRTRGGTGLGLSISRQLAREMGGDLTVSSKPGRGSCFTLWLPLA